MLSLTAVLFAMRFAVHASPQGMFTLGDTLGIGKIVAIVRDVAVLMDRDEAAAARAPVAFAQVEGSLEIDSGKLCNYPLGPQQNSIEVCRFIDSDTEWIVSEPDEAGRVRVADAAGARCVGYNSLEARTSTNLKAVGCDNTEYTTLFTVTTIGAGLVHDALESYYGQPILPVEGTPPSDAYQQLYIDNVNPAIAAVSGSQRK